MKFNLMSWYLSLDSGAIIALVAAVISLCALFLTCYQAYATRKHNRLSLSARLTTLVEVNRDTASFYSNIENTGVGPAVIKAYGVSIDGVKSLNKHINWVKALDSMGLPGDVKGMNLSPGEFIQPGKVYPLLSFESADPEFDCQTLLAAMRKIEIQIKYESVYGDKGDANLDFIQLNVANGTGPQVGP
jgi:hypothetical protein